ncbi:MAG: DUF4091 domain-containing protein [Tannerella sp.]|nr:DUF4091 domain-containing protein [Tannerella sp.]
MNVLKSILPVFVLLAIAGCNRMKVDDALYCVQIDPLEKAFKEELYFAENNDTAAVAKGETASFQWVFRSVYPVKNLKIEAGDLTNGDQRIAAGLKAFVGYVKSGYDLTGKKFYNPVSALYPDPLLEIETVDVSSMSNQPVWVSYTVPRDASGGVYSAEVVISGEINGEKFSLKKQATAKVYDVVLPEQTLWVTNMYWTDFLPKMNRDQPVIPYSDRYWELLKELAHSMRDHGQNVYPVMFELSRATLSPGLQYTFDFENFDKTVELFIREGDLKRLESGYFGGGNPLLWYVPDGNGGSKTLPFTNDTVRAYYSQYIPALFRHLESKGWDKGFMLHIADEPSDTKAYNEFASFIKKLEPNLKVIEATILGQKLENSVDIHVPIIWYYQTEEAFYKAHQQAGGEVWYYISCDARHYANRFLERELIQCRILHWINYRYDITGYLHWGLNYWKDEAGDRSLYVDDTDWVPAGDSWIIYPDYGKVYTSIRYEVTRDGIADYELLRLLEKKDAKKAEELAKAIVKNMDRYNTNIASFRAKRIQLLERLAQP